VTAEVDEDGEIVVMVSAMVSPITKHYCSDFSLYENRETGQWSRKIGLEGVDEYCLRGIGKLAGLIAHLQGALESVPVEHRDNVVFSFEYDYESGCDTEAYYYRPATDEELFKFKNLRKIDEQREEARQRKEYERLKIKFAD
jgi:hypothetical protein